MDFYIIPPNAHLNLMDLNKGNRYFCLAQIYHTNEKYKQFFKQKVAEGCWVTLDNGAGDHDLISEDVLFECMVDLMPSEVIPPDTLYDKDATLLALDSFVERMKRAELLDKIQIFAVPQGNDRQEWLDCYDAMLANDNVTTLGMSKLGIPHAFVGQAKDDQLIMESRHECVDLLLSQDKIKKPLHFLGQGNPLEFKKYVDLNNPLFRSTDSCNSVWSSMNMLDWTLQQFDRIKTPHDYFDRSLNVDHLALVFKNINYFKTIFEN